MIDVEVGTAALWNPDGPVKSSVTCVTKTVLSVYYKRNVRPWRFYYIYIYRERRILNVYWNSRTGITLLSSRVWNSPSFTPNRVSDPREHTAEHFCALTHSFSLPHSTLSYPARNRSLIGGIFEACECSAINCSYHAIISLIIIMTFIIIAGAVCEQSSESLAMVGHDLSSRRARARPCSSSGSRSFSRCCVHANRGCGVSQAWGASQRLEMH